MTWMLRKAGKGRGIIDVSRGIGTRATRLKVWKLRWHSMATLNLGVYFLVALVRSVSLAV